MMLNREQSSNCGAAVVDKAYGVLVKCSVKVDREHVLVGRGLAALKVHERDQPQTTVSRC